MDSSDKKGSTARGRDKKMHKSIKEQNSFVLNPDIRFGNFF